MRRWRTAEPITRWRIRLWIRLRGILSGLVVMLWDNRSLGLGTALNWLSREEVDVLAVVQRCVGPLEGNAENSVEVGMAAVHRLPRVHRPTSSTMEPPEIHLLGVAVDENRPVDDLDLLARIRRRV